MTDVAEKKTSAEGRIKEMFEAGAHYAYSKRRRHPSAKSLIFGKKNTVEIFDLEQTDEHLSDTLDYIEKLGTERKTILLVGTKREASAQVASAGERLSLPTVTNRWIGGTLSNFSEIKKRIEELKKLREESEGGLWSKYTKKEQLLKSRELDKLEMYFGGISSLTKLPSALFVIDPRHEHIAVHEARKKRIPVVALANSDCNFNELKHYIPANDSNRKSISYFMDLFVDAYEHGKQNAPIPKVVPEKGKKEIKDRKV